MTKININLGYKVKYPEGTQPENVPEEMAKLTKSYIEFAVTASYKDGLSSQFRRIFATIQSKIDVAISDKTYVVELGEGELNFLKNAFTDEKTKFTATLAQYVVVLEDEILGSSNK
jgi:hypothetical protein